MSRFRVNLNEPEEEQRIEPAPAATSASIDGEADATIPSDQTVNPAKSSRFRRAAKTAGIVFAALILVGAVGGYLYWRSVKKTPAYSLALLVESARRDDQQQLEKLIDTEAVVEDFMPQITGKAVELYGRNLSPQTVARVQQIAAPAKPIIRERAKMELPRVIREKTAPVEKVPYWVIALFANRGVDVSIEGETAIVKSKIPDRPLELTMKRDGEIWKVVGMKDEVLARKIAEKIGQELIAAAAKGGIKRAAEEFGVTGLEDLQNADIFR